MLLMRDSVTAADIPLEGLAAVAGYADGLYAWSAVDWARFPASVARLSIAVHPQDAGDVLDVETGDAVPSDVPGWCDRFNRPGRRAPTIYCNLGNWQAVRMAVGTRAVDYWIADYPGTTDPAAIPPMPGAVAQQFHDFGGYDESVIFDPTWLGAIPPVTGEEEMTPQLAQLTVWEWYPAYLGRVGTMDEVNYWAGQLTEPGANYLGVITAFYSTPEAVAWRTAHP